MAHIKILKDRKDGDIILPRTISQAVYHEGATMHSVIKKLKTQVEKNKEGIDICLDALTWKKDTND